jgi:hypothetical protein
MAVVACQNTTGSQEVPLSAVELLVGWLKAHLLCGLLYVVQELVQDGHGSTLRDR